VSKPDLEGDASAPVRDDPFTYATEASRTLAALTGRAHHDVAVILGSGLSVAAATIGSPTARLGFAQLPGFPAKVPGGQVPEVWSVEVAGRSVLVFLGRLHLYEGHGAGKVAHPVRAALSAGCEVVVLTNASGALRPGLAPGDLVLISDHLNLTGVSPLTGLSKGQGAASPFVDLTDAWAPRLRKLAREVDPTLPEGVYAQMPGPHFETPAEIRMLRALGADLVGMSSVLEAIAARHLGADLLGVSVVSNLAAGISPGGVSSTSLVEVASSRAKYLGEVLREVIARL
jgi:purine-nucleoside phosphorylase